MSETIEFKTNKEKDWLINLLRDSVVTVTFVKKDGTERDMRCTLRKDKLPIFQESTEEKKTRKKSEEAVAVYDLEKEAWRSFRWDSIKRIQFNIDGE